MNVFRRTLSALFAVALCLGGAALSEGGTTHSFAEFSIDIPDGMVVFTHDNLSEDHPYAGVYDIEFIRQAAFAEEQHYLLAIPVEYAGNDDYFELHALLYPQPGASDDLLEKVVSDGEEQAFLDTLAGAYRDSYGADIRSIETVSIEGKLWVSIYGIFPEGEPGRYMHQYLTYMEVGGVPGALTLRADAWTGEFPEHADACLDAVARSLRIHGGDSE